MGLKSRLTAAVLGLIITGASTFGIAFQFLMEKEGMRLKAYQDGRGIWTICLGHTLGVKPGDTATMEQCLKWAEEEIGPAISRTTELSPVALSPAATVGIASFCFYNLGETKCHWTVDKATGKRRPTKFWALWMAGDMNRACDAITAWVYDGGKDCRIRSNNCYGQVERRAQERELCLIGQ